MFCLSLYINNMPTKPTYNCGGKITLLVIVTLFFQLKAAAQDSFKDKLVKDLDAYKSGIMYDHVDAFSKINKDEFKHNLDSLKNNATKYNGDELLVALMRLNATVGDEHTRIRVKDSSFYPCAFFWFSEGLCIMGTDMAHSKARLTKIVSIGGKPIETAVQLFDELLPDKNKMSIRYEIPNLLIIPSVMHGLGLTDAQYELTINSVNENGESITTLFSPKPYKELGVELPPVDRQLLRNKHRGNYWYEYDSSANLVYFKYARCAEDEKAPFDKFERTLEKEIKKREPDRIIIDMRYNGGGSTRLLEPFIEWLVTSKLNKKGKIFVLIGRRTFSAAVLNAIDLKRQTHTILAGEESGGSVNHFGEIKYFDLPNTGMKVSYSTKYIQRNSSYNGPLLPDLRFEEKFSDYVKGVDALLEYVSIVRVQ